MVNDNLLCGSAEMEVEQQDDDWTTATFTVICTCDNGVPE